MLATIGLLCVAGAYGGPLYLNSESPLMIHSGMKTRFYAPLNANGLTAANPATSWPVAGVPAPSSVVWMDDPTGASGLSTEAWTATGTPAEVDSPFRPDGGWSDLTAAGGMHARRFDGVNEYYTSNTASIWSPNSGDFSVCTLFSTSAASGMLAGDREAAGEGWGLYFDASYIAFYVNNAAGTQRFVLFNTFDPRYGAYNMCCAAHDYDGNMTAYCNGVADPTTQVSPGGVIAPDVSARIGANISATSDFTGTIAFVMYWPSLLSAANVTALWQHFQGILDTKGAPIAVSTTVGPICATVDGQLECYGDDWQVLGSEMPVGATGAGTPASGLYVAPSQTNSIIQGDNLAVSWTTVDGGGAAVVSAAATSPYRDGRAVSRLTDDQAGTIEYAQSAGNTVTSLNAGDKIQVTVWARDASGTVLDFQAVESGVCGGSATNYAAKTITTTWTSYTWEHTLADTTCTTFQVRLSPADFAAAANTGTADVGAVGVWMNNGAAGGQAYVPPFFCPTTTAAVTCGSSILGYTITGKGIVSATGTLVGEVRMSMKFAPAVDSQLSTAAYPMSISKDATDALSFLWTTAELFVVRDDSSHATSSAYSTVGALATIKGSANYDSDKYFIELNGTRTTDATADTTPAGLTTVLFGSRTAAATLVTGGFWTEEAKVER